MVLLRRGRTLSYITLGDNDGEGAAAILAGTLAGSIAQLGIVIAALLVVIMPVLGRAKRKVADGLESSALRADATQTDLCTYLSAIVLGGLALNTLLGWWWAVPVAALLVPPIREKEGFEVLRANTVCDACRLH